MLRRRWHRDQLDRPTVPVHHRKSPGTFQDDVTSSMPRAGAIFMRCMPGGEALPLETGLPRRFRSNSSFARRPEACSFVCRN